MINTTIISSTSVNPRSSAPPPARRRWHITCSLPCELRTVVGREPSVALDAAGFRGIRPAGRYVPGEEKGNDDSPSSLRLPSGTQRNPVGLQCFPGMCKRSRAEARDRRLLSLEVRCYQPTDESVSQPAIVASTVTSRRCPSRSRYRRSGPPRCRRWRTWCPTSSRSGCTRASPRHRRRTDDDRDLVRSQYPTRAKARSSRGRRGGHVGRERLVVREEGLLGGEAVAEVGLRRTVLRPLTGTKEGRNGDRDQDGNDQDDNHELDERETFLVVPAGLEGVDQHLYDPFRDGLEERGVVRRTSSPRDISAAGSRRLRREAHDSGEPGTPVRPAPNAAGCGPCRPARFWALLVVSAIVLVGARVTVAAPEACPAPTAAAARGECGGRGGLGRRQPVPRAGPIPTQSTDPEPTWAAIPWSATRA